ncbi:Hypothetical protein FKW44_000280, partial [Caligus rogercresseyi]
KIWLVDQVQNDRYLAFKEDEFWPSRMWLPYLPDCALLDNCIFDYVESKAYKTPTLMSMP